MSQLLTIFKAANDAETRQTDAQLGLNRLLSFAAQNYFDLGRISSLCAMTMF